MFALLCAAGLTGAAQAADVYFRANGLATGDYSTPDTYMKRVTTNLHLTANNTYWLDGIIGVAAGAVLTIDPGTVIRGVNEINTAQYRPGMLIVERGAKIYANGTVDKPIIFTDEWDNNVPGMTAGPVARTWKFVTGAGGAALTVTNTYDYAALGDQHGSWGGVVLCGNAFLADNTRSRELGASTYPVEGVGTTYNIEGGGRDDDDSSGVFRYVQLRYGGYPLANTKELNGLTMYGVGRGTELHHVEIFNNHDDGIEWFGGTVNGKYLAVIGAGDDTFDSDCGYRGKNQFLFGLQKNLGGSKYEAGCPDKGMEMDGDESAPVAAPTATGKQEPLAASAWYNITMVGWNGSATSGKQRNGAIQMRDDATPQIWNSLFLNFGAFGTLIENKAGVGKYESYQHFTNGNTLADMPATTTTNLVIGASGLASASVGPAYFYQAQQPDMQACVRGCTFWKCYGKSGTNTFAPQGLQTAAGADQAVFGGDTGGKGPIIDKGDNIDLKNGPYANVDVTAVGDRPIVALSSRAYDRALSWSSALVATQVSANVIAGDTITNINPLVTGPSATNAVAISTADGWLTATAYRGAFGDRNWARGWTLSDKLGLFGTPAATNGQQTVVQAFGVKPVGTFDTVEGRTYIVESSTSVGGPWTTFMTLVGTGASVPFADIGATAPTMFYRVTVQ
jgi:hypothetical protein